jgi:hypothetical protein
MLIKSKKDRSSTITEAVDTVVRASKSWTVNWYERTLQRLCRELAGSILVEVRVKMR